MRIIDEEQLDFDDLLICPKIPPENSNVTSRSQISLTREFKWWNKDNTQKFSIRAVPVGTSNMGTVGTCSFARQMVLSNHIACLEKHIPYEDIHRLVEDLKLLQANEIHDVQDSTYLKLIPSVGIRESIDDIKKLYDVDGLRILMVDAPNGYLTSLINRVAEIHKACPDAFIVAGNVVTADGLGALVKAGAKAAKVGIGNGSCCRTRVKTGVGRPQASALIECADIAHQHGCYVMCDGGVTNAGDVCKAFGCGADLIISGSLFAGCDAAEGEVIEKNGRKYKQYYGMSSHLAQEKHFGGVRKYSASEGIEKLIPYVGTLEDVLQDIDGGIKSACTYIGCTKMKNFCRHTSFYKVHKQFNAIYENCQNIA